MSNPSQTVPVDRSSTSPGPTQPAPAPEDDMIDTPADFKRWPFLRHVLGECRDLLVSVYQHSDEAALSAQRVHRQWVVAAALFATLAVSIAILQLAGLRKSMPVLEGAAVIAAAWAFREGQKSRERWLTERHKAERCRLLKFSSLIRPDAWALGGLPSGECAPELGGQTDAVRFMSFEDVKKWLDNDNLPSPPGRILPRSLKELTELRDYYREKRLKFQASYFKRQSERDVKRDERWRDLPHRLFTASVMIVGLHVIIEAARYLAERMHLTGPTESLPWLEVLLDAAIACAALLPVIGSGIRTWRSAHEATRNISRFRAKHLALSNIEHRLEGKEIRDAAEAESVLRDLWCAEQIMESEHREWLRLMMEAEWLG